MGLLYRSAARLSSSGLRKKPSPMPVMPPSKPSYCRISEHPPPALPPQHPLSGGRRWPKPRSRPRQVPRRQTRAAPETLEREIIDALEEEVEFPQETQDVRWTPMSRHFFHKTSECPLTPLSSID